MNDLLEKIRGLPQTQQRILFILGVIATICGFLAALDEYSSALKPGFLGATVGSIVKDYINYLLGRKGPQDASTTTTAND